MKTPATAAIVLVAALLTGGCTYAPPQSAEDCMKGGLDLKGTMECLNTFGAQISSSTAAMPTGRPKVDWSAGAPADWERQIDRMAIVQDCAGIESAIATLPAADRAIQARLIGKSEVFHCR